MPKSRTQDEMLKLLRERTFGYGAMSRFAAEAGVSLAYVSETLKGRRPVSEKIARALGFERRVVYRKVEVIDEKAA